MFLYYILHSFYHAINNLLGVMTSAILTLRIDKLIKKGQQKMNGINMQIFLKNYGE